MEPAPERSRKYNFLVGNVVNRTREIMVSNGTHPHETNEVISTHTHTRARARIYIYIYRERERERETASLV